MTLGPIERSRAKETSERPTLLPASPGEREAVGLAVASTRCPGREAELATLEAAARAIDAERLLLIEGPSGIGKSRLLTEFRSRVRLEGGVVLEGSCEPGRPFGPFAEIVERALRFLGDVGDPRRRIDASLLEELGRTHDDAALARDAALAPRPIGGAHEALALERKLRFFDAIAGLLREVSGVRPPVVLIHHLERADASTLDLLAFLLEGGASFPCEPGTCGERGALHALFVASHRSDPSGSTPAPSRLERLRSLEACRVVSLGPLDATGLRAYLTSEELIDRLLTLTGGHPDRLERLLDAEPMTERSQVMRRLARLDDDERALIEALAVFGRPATLETLVEVLGVGEARARDLARSELVTRTILDGQVRFAFEREAQRVVVYDALGEGRRRELHARAVEVCARERARADAVRHAISSGDLERASALARAAAASLSARCAHDEAAALLESLVDAIPNVPSALRVDLVEHHRMAGDYRAALEHARALEEASPDEAEHTARVGELLLLSGDLVGAERRLAHALDRASSGRRAPVRLAVEIQVALAETQYRAGRYDEARRTAEAAAQAARAIDLTSIAIDARNILGKLALAQRQADRAVEIFVANGEGARHAGLGHLEAQAWTNLAIAHLQRDDLAQAERWCLRAIETATLASDTRDRAIATENLAVLAHLARDYERALGHYLTALGLLKRLGNRALIVRVLRNLGELHLSLGDVARARSLSDRAARLAGPATPPPVTAERLLLCGRIEAAERRSSEARSAFEGALDILEELDDGRADDVRLELALVAIEEGDLEAASTLLDAVAPFDGKQADGKREAARAYAAASLARASGRDALPSARLAVTLAEKLGDDERILASTVLLAQVLLDAGEVGLAMRAHERARATEARLFEHVPKAAASAWIERPLRRALAGIERRLEAPERDSIEPTPPRSARASCVERSDRARGGSLVGSSAGIRRVLDVVSKVAPHDTIVLVRGESGTGKELVAEAIHQRSPRASRPLIKVNCAALVETLLLSELFGHERGAFTGAQARKKGRFEIADGGTLFLDEIGDISPKTQAALLRVLQEREFERVGGTQPIRVDVRIVCATHRDLEKMVRGGSFREDLYYRLRGVMIEMPALRRRLDDLPELARHLLARIATERGESVRSLSSDALAFLAQHRWPGNVRELENVLRAATLFADDPTIGADDLVPLLDGVEPAAPSAKGTDGSADRGEIEELAYERLRRGTTSLFDLKKNLERECIARALGETNGNITRAAALLGMKRPRLSQLVKEYELGDPGK